MSDECGAYAHTMRAPKCRATVVEIVNQIIPMRRLRMGCCSSWCGDGTDGLVCETGLVGSELYFMSKPSNLSERLDLCPTVAWQKLLSLRGIGRCREPYSPEEGCGLSSKAPWPRS